MKDNALETFVESIKDHPNFLKFAYNEVVFEAGKTPVYYAGPYWDEKEIIAAMNSFLFGKWISSGDQVRKFERKFCDKFDQSFGLMVNSGSSANLVMLAALKKYFIWDDKAEIIVSVVGFPTTISCIVQNNLVPVFIDIEDETLNFDLEEIRKKITDNTKAIFLSPVLGNPPNMQVLLSICEENGIKLILDGCDSLGSTYNGKHLSSFAITTSHSFYPAHHISTGEGGMVTSNNMEIIKLARSFAWWGKDCYCVGAANLCKEGVCGKRFSNWLAPQYEGVVDHKYVFNVIGYNVKPLDLQGAIGIEQLKKFSEIKLNRNCSKGVIDSFVKKHLGLKAQTINALPGNEPCWFGTPIVMKTIEEKRSLVAHLESHKIQTRNYFAGNILYHPGFMHLGDYNDYPNACKVLDHVFFLGASPSYTKEVFEYIEKVFKLWDFRA